MGRSDKDEIDDFLTAAKQCGVMGKQATTLKIFFGKKKKKKKEKTMKEKPKESKPRQKDHAELKIEARPKLEKYMRDNGIWQIDLFDLMVDQYEIYCVEDFLDYKEDEDWIDDFLTAAKQRGVMGKQLQQLKILCGR